jgi:hypothetical protein
MGIGSLIGSVLVIFAFGGLYCFLGKKFYAILHGINCGLIGFGFGFLVLSGVTGSLIVGILAGLAAGVGCGLWCFKLEKVQAFVLGS